MEIKGIHAPGARIPNFSHTESYAAYANSQNEREITSVSEQIHLGQPRYQAGLHAFMYVEDFFKWDREFMCTHRNLLL
jgi:hypothetical protein